MAMPKIRNSATSGCEIIHIAHVRALPHEAHGVMARFPLRLFEWMTTSMMLGIAVTISASPRTIASGGFHLMQNIGLSPDRLGWVFALAGAARVVALWANGNWRPYGSWCRALGALAGALLWGQMCLALWWWSEEAGHISIGVPVYLCLCIGEIVSCSRAASDGNRTG